MPLITYCDILGGWDGVGNIDADPLFVVPFTGNVCSQSPCIDAGDPSILDPDSSPSDMGLFFQDHPECSFGNIIIRYVSTGGNDIAGDGTPENPFRTIQYAVDLSQSGDTIVVGNGTYVENVIVLGKSILLTSNYLFSGDSLDIENTVIDGNSASTVITLVGGDSLSAITGFTITNGSNGGIVCFSSGSTISANTISGNLALRGGGIFCRDNSSPTISANIISGNSANDGGGINCHNSNPTISDNTISGNSAIGSFDFGRGGGIYCTNNSNPTIRANIINDNSARDGGGISCVNNSSPIISNNIIRGNSPFGLFGRGGGISCLSNSRPTISANIITANFGSGVYCDNSSPVIVNTIIWANVGAQIDTVSSSMPLITYSDILSGWEGEGNIDADPLFVFPFNGNVCSQSPCIDAGDPSILDPDSSPSDMGLFFSDRSECSFGNIWYVSTGGSDGIGNGSRGNPFRTIQYAVDLSFSGDTIVVGNGTYGENVIVPGKSIVLTSNSLFSEDTLDIKNTVIDGNSAYTVITLVGCDSLTTLTGFTIRNGRGSDAGGINCINSSNPTISHNSITSNISIGFGGGGIACVTNPAPLSGPTPSAEM